MRRTSAARAVIGALGLTVAIPASGGTVDETTPVRVAEMPAHGGCPVLESADWTAWLNMQPGPSGPSLHVSGQVVLPAPGFTVEGRLGPLDRRQPPSQRVVLEFASPQGVVAQVLSTEDVQLALPALANTYRAVVVTCGETTLAEITEIDTVR